MAERDWKQWRGVGVETLERRRLLSAAWVVGPASGNNSFYLKEDADQLHVDLWHNSAKPGTGKPTQSMLISAVTHIVVNGGSGNDTLTQASALPVTVIFNGAGGNDTLNVLAGTYTIAGDPAKSSSHLTINDAGQLYFDSAAAGSGIHAIHLAALNVLAGGSAVVDTPVAYASRAVMELSSLSIASTGLLDLNANDLMVHTGNLATLSALISKGENAGGALWRGTSGITSSFAAADSTHSTGLGVIANKNGSKALLGTFDNQPAVMSDVLIRYQPNGSAFTTSVPAGSAIGFELNHALDVAEEQSQKTEADLGSTGLYPQYVNVDGSISTVPNTHWTVGTWAGLLWALYEATGKSYFKTEATAFTNPLSVDDTQTSDVGFRIYDSFYPLLQQQPGNAAVTRILLAAAAAKATTFNSTVGAFEAWRTSTSGNPAANFNVLMDLIMDSPLMFWAAKQTGNQTYYNEAVSNAVIEENYLVHADGTSSQFAYFNSSNGAFVDNETYQGYSNTSTWARGEAWAIYGFAQCYAATGRADFLATSEKTADWFIAHLPGDDVPYWDFNAPVNSSTYRDTSAAAVAASGLLQLSRLIATSDPTNSTKYRNAAAAILASLASSKYLNDPISANNGTLAQGALNVPAGVGDDNPIYFGDYYFVQAIDAYLGL